VSKEVHIYTEIETKYETSAKETITTITEQHETKNVHT